MQLLRAPVSDQALSDPETEHGGELLARISNEMVKSQNARCATSVVFDSEGSSDGIEATAEGQLDEPEVGAATDECALDSPSSSGQ